MVYKKENTQKTIISKQQEKDIINNKQNQQKIRQKTTSYVIALILTIFGIIFLFSFLTTTNMNDNLKITGYVTGPPSNCQSSPCDINECGYLGRSNTTYVLAQDIDGGGADVCFQTGYTTHIILDCNGHSITNVNKGMLLGSWNAIKNCNIVATSVAVVLSAHGMIIDSNLQTTGPSSTTIYANNCISNTLVDNCYIKATGVNSSGYYFPNSNCPNNYNILSNSTISVTAPSSMAIFLTDFRNGSFVNNTFINSSSSSTSPLVLLNNYLSNINFCLNRFIITTTGDYVRSEGSTISSVDFNCIYDGKNQGNIWPNINDLNIIGTERSSVPGYLIGTSGLDYPFSSHLHGIYVPIYDYAPLLDLGDSDGVPGYEDNCPWDNNPYQEDSEGDGYGNVCDNCQYNWNPDQNDDDNDGIGDACDVDQDADNVQDDFDNCPTVYNPKVNGVQPDADGDNVGDACDYDADNDFLCFPLNNDQCPGQTVPDNCPIVPNPDQNDSDGDGLGNLCDNCPDDINPGQGDYDQDEIGDACDQDAENDGILNNVDNCPTTPNPLQWDTDKDGIGDMCDIPMCQ